MMNTNISTISADPLTERTTTENGSSIRRGILEDTPIQEVESPGVIRSRIENTEPEADNQHVPLVEQTSSNNYIGTGIAGIAAGATAIVCLLHPAGAPLILMSAAAPGATAATAGAAAATGATAASFYSILHAGAAVTIPMAALFIGAHELEHVRHTLTRNFTSIASSTVAVEIALHPSVGGVLLAGLNAMVANPITTTTILVVGGLVALDHNIPHAPAVHYTDSNRTTHHHIEGTALRRGVRIIANATAGYFIATDPAAVGILVNNTIHVLGAGFSALMHTSAPAGMYSYTTVALTHPTAALAPQAMMAATTSAAFSSIATSSVAPQAAPPVAAALVPHSMSSIMTLASHAGMTKVAAAFVAGVAAHPLAITLGLAVGACALASKIGASAQSATSSPDKPSEPTTSATSSTASKASNKKTGPYSSYSRTGAKF